MANRRLQGDPSVAVALTVELAVEQEKILEAKSMKVEIAKLDTEWLERLYTIVEIARRAVIIVTLLFACAVLLMQ